MATFFEQLAARNPWWIGRPFESGRERKKYLDTIRRYLKTGEIIVLSGVRRSGKTTLLYQTIRLLLTEKKVPAKNILFVNCDDPEIAERKNALIEAVDTYRREIAVTGTIWVVFDEVQSVEGWERQVKSLYDKKACRILLSGSSSCLLDTQVGTLLSGRYFTVTVFPLDFPEYLRFQGIRVPEDAATLAAQKYEITTHLRRYLYEGGFPVVVLQQDERTKQDYLRAYYDSIVYRDIVRTNDVRNQKALTGLLQYLFTNIATPYSYRRIREMLGTDIDTVRDYIHFAGLARILFEVQAFAYSLQVQARQNKKIYCIDNGLRNAVSFRFSDDEGKLAENLVFLELLRSGHIPYYWKGNREVDFVIKTTGNSLVALNVCYTDKVPEREFESLREFNDAFKKTVKSRIILTKDYAAEERGIMCIPLWKWLLQDHGDLLR